MAKVVWHQNMKKNHLQLAFECKGGGVGMVSSKSENRTTSGSLLHAREVV